MPTVHINRFSSFHNIKEDEKMCNNKQYSDEEKVRIKLMQKYAVAILKGMTLEEIAADNGVSDQEVVDYLKEIQDINPELFNQLSEKMDGLL